MKERETRVITEMAIFIAIALVLDILAGIIGNFLPLFKYGGSISPAMLPIFLLAYRHGLKKGLISGFLFGVLQALFAEAFGYGVFGLIMEEGWYKFILMFLLDYIVPFTALGFAAVFKNALHEKIPFVLGIALGSFLRYLSHGFSGVLVWSYYAEQLGLNKWLYSFVLYNLPYMAASFALCVIVGLLLHKRNIFLTGISEEN